jgi:hypothetical protein
MSNQMEVVRVVARAPVRTEETRRRGRTRAARWAGALVAFALALVGAATVIARTASTGPRIDGLLSQVQEKFGDDGLRSASVNGSTLTVNVAAPDEPSTVRTTFEAQMLAAAFHDAVRASGRKPIATVQFQDASGTAIPGYGPAPVESGTSVPELSSGACSRAARAVRTSSLVIRSVLTLPYAGGACAFTFRTSAPANFDASLAIGKLANAVGAPNQRPLLVELEDQAGVPLLVDSFTPSGGGTVYIKPGFKTDLLP